MSAAVNVDYLMMALTLLLPLLSFVLLCLTPSSLQRKGIFIASVLQGIAVISAGMYFAFSPGTVYRYLIWQWIKVKTWSLQLGLVHFPETAFLVFTVALLGFLIWIFSISYLHGHRHRLRYFRHLSLFIFGMQGLLMAPGLGQFFFGWELIGISSYLLIGFYREDKEAARASSSAFLHNKVGDLGLLMSMSVLLLAGGSVDFTALADLRNEGIFPESLIYLAGFGFLVAAIAKSAQVPLQGWLPEAMAGPTPISALIHAATLVVAGIVLILRVKPLLLPAHFEVLLFISASTALIAAVMALFQQDLKKLLAWSTISQLAWMIMAICKGGSLASLQHLYAHAFFKSGLFLFAGVLILNAHHSHLVNHTKITGLQTWLRQQHWLYASGLLLFLSLSGFPFTASFLSKEQLLSLFYQNGSGISDPYFWIGLVIPMLTSAYAFRLYLLVFQKDEAVPDVSKAWSPPFVLWLIPFVLAIIGLFPLLSLHPFMITDGWGPLKGAGVISGTLMVEESIQLLILSLVLTFTGWVLGYFLVKRELSLMALNDLHWRRTIRLLVTSPVCHISKALFFFDRRILDQALELFSKSVVVMAHVLRQVDRQLIDGSIRVFNQMLYHAGPWGASASGGKLQVYMARTALILLLLVGLVVMNWS